MFPHMPGFKHLTHLNLDICGPLFHDMKSRRGRRKKKKRLSRCILFVRRGEESRLSKDVATVNQRYLVTASWEWQQQTPFVPTLSESFAHMQKRIRLNRIPRMQCQRNKVRMGRLERGRLSEDQLYQWSHYQDRIPRELTIQNEN